MKTKNSFMMFAVMFFLFAFVSSVMAIELKTTKANPSDVKGTYKLMLYGCSTPSSTENVAILVKDDSTYAIDLFAPETSYMVTSRISGTDALAKAEQFLKCNSAANGNQLRKIMGPDGSILGYELIPLYSGSTPLYSGSSDIPTHYSFNKKKNRVRAYVKTEVSPDDNE